MQQQGRTATPTPPSWQRSNWGSGSRGASTGGGWASDRGGDEKEARSASNSGSPAVPAPHAAAKLPSVAGSVAELKAKLAARGINSSAYVEKADLRALWLRSFKTSAAAAAAAEAVRRSAQETPPPWQKPWQGQSAQKPTRAEAAPAATAAVSAQDLREARGQDAKQEVARILQFRQESFRSAAAWGFAMLGVPPGQRDTATVHRCYRALMKQLHPDKAEQSEGVAEAMELVREAREAAERSLLRLQPPDQPRALRVSVSGGGAGRRRIRLSWEAPADVRGAPVARYTVAVVDPAYGRALAVAQLEPDYSQELGRFLPIEELTSYVLSEEDLQKMPRFWQQHRATVQVAAGNDAGQSTWAVLEVSLQRR